MVTFDCKAIDHAVIFLPDGKIAPCCVIKGDYKKDIVRLHDIDRFHDLKIDSTPTNCMDCVKYPSQSAKNIFNQYTSGGIRYIDFRNSNLCNFKCRTCGPHLSSSWAQELNLEQKNIKTDVSKYINEVLTGDIDTIYFAGGEPFLNNDHWELLQKLNELNLAQNIKLIYSTNLSLLKYKTFDIFELWKNFKHIKIMASADATGVAFNYIRSGGNWNTFDKNIQILLDKQKKLKSLEITICYLMSAISVWFLPEILEYAEKNKLQTIIMQLINPHYFTLNVFPDELVDKCLQVLETSKEKFPGYLDQIELAMNTVKNNDDKNSFLTLINNILLTDKIRNENLFDLLPFQEHAIKKTYAKQ